MNSIDSKMLQNRPVIKDIAEAYQISVKWAKKVAIAYSVSRGALSKTRLVCQNSDSKLANNQDFDQKRIESTNHVK